MSPNIEKAKEWSSRIQENAIQEVYGDLPFSFINFLNNPTINYCLHDFKTGIKQDFAIRVVNSWLAQDVIKLQEGDKGKIKRFNRLENIWLNIVFDARKLGISLDTLKSLRSTLLESSIKNFSLFKLGVLKTIFSMPQVIVFPIDGSPEMFSVEAYNNWFPKRRFPAHTVFYLEDYIVSEYPNYNESNSFEIKGVLEDNNKMLLTYFIITGDYDYLKIYLGEADIRVIENSKSLLKNEELLESISNWKFDKIEVNINDEVETTITMSK